MDIPDISEKNFEEAIEQALLAALPRVDLDGTLKEKQPAPLYGALTANLTTGDVVLGGYIKRKSEERIMAVYFIADLDIRDPEGYRTYARQVPAP